MRFYISFYPRGWAKTRQLDVNAFWPALLAPLPAERKLEHRRDKPEARKFPDGDAAHGRDAANLLRHSMAADSHTNTCTRGKARNTHRGARTHDHKVKGLALCRLS